MSKVELSEACLRHLAARWDEGHEATSDDRFNSTAPGMLDCAVVEVEIEDIMEYRELRGITAVALSQDGETYYTTDEEAEDDA